MRKLLGTTALAALLALGGTVAAQDQSTAPAAATTQGTGSLPDLQRSLMQMTERLREAPHGGSTNLQQTAQEARDLLANLQQRVGELPQTQRPQVQSAIQKAQQAIEGQDPATMATAMENVQDSMASASAAEAGQGEGGGSGVTIPQQPASAAERQTMNEGSETATTGMPDGTTAQTGTAQQQIQPEPDQQAAATQEEGPLAGKTPDDLIDQTLYSASGEEIGEIDEVVQSPQEQIPAAVVGVGGFLGIGERSVAIPIRELDLQGERYSTGMTREQIEALPEYTEGAFQPLSRNRAFGSAASK
jgi:hypothetical protein